MTTKAELVEQARQQGIDTEGMTKARLEEALQAAAAHQALRAIAAEQRRGTYSPQERRHQQGET